MHLAPRIGPKRLELVENAVIIEERIREKNFTGDTPMSTRRMIEFVTNAWNRSAPMTTAAPPRWRRISSAMAYTSSAEKATIDDYVQKGDVTLALRIFDVFLERKLREQFGFAGTPLRISFRSRHEAP